MSVCFLKFCNFVRSVEEIIPLPSRSLESNRRANFEEAGLTKKWRFKAVLEGFNDVRQGITGVASGFCLRLPLDARCQHFVRLLIRALSKTLTLG